MKRLLLAALFAGGALSVTFVLRPGPLAGQAPSSSVAGLPCCKETLCKEMSCCSPAKKTKNDAEVVAELVKILEQTKSADTFVATLLALSQFEDKSPLPAVVRNAGRLGLLKGICKEDKPNHAQEMIGAYLSGEMVESCRVGGRRNDALVPAGYYPPCVPPMPLNYGPPTCPQISTFAPAPLPAPVRAGCCVPATGGPCMTSPLPEPIAAPKLSIPVSTAPAVKDSASAQLFSFWVGLMR